MTDVASHDANIQKTIFEASCDALGMAMLVCDKNDCIIFASRQLLQFYPIASSFLTPGTRLRDFLGAVYDTGVRLGTTSDYARKRLGREEWISERISVQWRERFETMERLGRNRWVQVRKRRLANGLGILSIIDITEQKKREEQSQIDLDRIGVTEEILDSIPSPLFVKDRNLAYVAVNKAFCRIHDLTPEDILGRTAWDLVDSDLAERFELSDRAVMETGEPSKLPEQIVSADGEDMWVITNKYRVGPPGKHLLVTLMADVTGVVDWQQLSGNAEGRPFAVDYNAFEPGQNCYDPYRSLDLNFMVETGAAPLPEHVVGARILVTTANPMLEERLIGRLRKWGFDACAAHDANLQAAVLAAASEAGLSVNLLLIDDALPDVQIALFNRQNIPSAIISSATTDTTLLSEIVTLCETDRSEELLGGERLHAEGDEEPAPPLHVDVLVAEDNEINQFVFSQILEGLGISFRIAENGERAVELWQQLKPQMILMDISMPVMNGLDATAIIRKAEKQSGGRTPIIGVAAQASDMDEESCKVSGMDGYIMKPISPDMVETVYRRHAPQPQRKAS